MKVLVDANRKGRWSQDFFSPELAGERCWGRQYSRARKRVEILTSLLGELQILRGETQCISNVKVQISESFRFYNHANQEILKRFLRNSNTSQDLVYPPTDPLKITWKDEKVKRFCCELTGNNCNFKGGCD